MEPSLQAAPARARQPEVIRVSAIHSNPRIARLNRTSMGYRDEWIIVATTPTEGFTALHEVEQLGSPPRVMDHVSLNSLLDVETFASSLTVQGWMRQGEQN
jgi:hypothetical protein